MTLAVDLNKWQKTVELLAELYGAASASVMALQEDGFEVVCTSGGGENTLDTACTGFPVTINSYCRRVMETDDMLYVSQGDQDPEWKDELPVRIGNVISYLGFPIRWPDERFFGTICIKNNAGTDYSEVFVRTLEQFRDLIEADLLLAHRADELEKMSQTDPPTGCANRRGLQDYVKRQVPDMQRGWGVLYLDLDNLKVTNDQFGHEAGDRAIEILANVLRAQVRSTDIAARVGGDEFVLIARLPSAKILDQLRMRVITAFDTAIASASELRFIGVSVGATYLEPTDGPPDVDTLLACADQQMYDCKRQRKANQGHVPKRTSHPSRPPS